MPIGFNACTRAAPRSSPERSAAPSLARFAASLRSSTCSSLCAVACACVELCAVTTHLTRPSFHLRLLAVSSDCVNRDSLPHCSPTLSPSSPFAWERCSPRLRAAGSSFQLPRRVFLDTRADSRVCRFSRVYTALSAHRSSWFYGVRFLRTRFFFLRTCPARPIRAHTCSAITRRLCGWLGASGTQGSRALRLY